MPSIDKLEFNNPYNESYYTFYSDGPGIVDQYELYFLTLTIVDWVDVFTRAWYKDIIVDSLNHCVKYKGLKIYGWVIMSNHLHLIARSKEGDLSGTLRDFKKFTSKAIIKSIEENPESRKEWMLEKFILSHGSKIRNSKYKLWKRGNCPIHLAKTQWIHQTLNYIHNNLVKARCVFKPEDYPWSSAVDYMTNKKGLVLIECV